MIDRATNPSRDSEPVLSFEEARRVVEKHAAEISAREIETIELLDAFGRVLAQEILADRDFPPFPRSTRDGYAVLAADVAKVPALLDLVGEIKAGQKLEEIPQIAKGQAAAIMTGAPVPTGADAVLMVEYTSRAGERVEITKSVEIGANVVERGAEARRGDVLLRCGTRINDAAIAIAASVGKRQVEVFRKPRIAVLATGDELVGIDESPAATEIRNSNSYSLAAQVKAAGGEAAILPVAKDDAVELKKLSEEGLRADLLLLSGGVSMGRYDLVEQVLAEMEAEFFFTGAKIQPGRPVVFGKVRGGVGSDGLNGKFFFGLPGNPVSTMVTFELFVRPMLDALAGMTPQKLRFLQAKLKSEIRIKTGLKRFLPAVLSGEFEDSVVELISWQGSGDIAATARANCYIVVPPNRERIEAGEFVPVMLR